MPEIVNTTPLAIKSSFDEANDNRPIMVDVDHVSMIFNMASEQLNSIKEYMDRPRQTRAHVQRVSRA